MSVSSPWHTEEAQSIQFICGQAEPLIFFLANTIARGGKPSPNKLPALVVWCCSNRCQYRILCQVEIVCRNRHFMFICSVGVYLIFPSFFSPAVPGSGSGEPGRLSDVKPPCARSRRVFLATLEFLTRGHEPPPPGGGNVDMKRERESRPHSDTNILIKNIQLLINMMWWVQAVVKLTFFSFQFSKQEPLEM